MNWILHCWKSLKCTQFPSQLKYCDVTQASNVIYQGLEFIVHLQYLHPVLLVFLSLYIVQSHFIYHKQCIMGMF